MVQVAFSETPEQTGIPVERNLKNHANRSEYVTYFSATWVYENIKILKEQVDANQNKVYGIKAY